MSEPNELTKVRGVPDKGRNGTTLKSYLQTIHSPESISLVSIERAGLSKPFNSIRLEGSDAADVEDDVRICLFIEEPANIDKGMFMHWIHIIYHFTMRFIYSVIIKTQCNQDKNLLHN